MLSVTPVRGTGIMPETVLRTTVGSDPREQNAEKEGGGAEIRGKNV